MNLPYLPSALALLLAADVCLADRSKPDETKTQFALRMDTPPVIDGNIDAAEWRQAGGSTGNWTVTVRPALDADGNPVLDDQGNPVNIIVGGAIGDAGTVPTSSADLSYTIQAGFDADNLYIAVRVKDDAISTDSAAEGSANGTTWMDDSVEVFIDGDNSNYPSRDTSGTNPSVVGSGGQFVITANNAYREAEAGNPGYGETAKWFAKTTVRSDGTGYDAEFRISLAAIGNPKPGELIGFSVGVNDDDTGGGAKRQVIWVGKPHTECTYGNLVLGQKSYTAPKASTAPTVDGVIHPEEYAGAQEITINGGFGTFYTGGMLDGLDRQDLSYRAWVVHDTDAVYVAVDVVDDKILTDSADPGSEDKTTWEDDSVEIFFDPTHAKNINRGPEKGTGQYVLTANGAWRDAEANNPTFGETEEWFAATKRTFKGYQVEFKVNKSVLQDPVDGKLMGFNIAVNDDDGKGRKAQLNWDGDPHHEFTYGELTLGGPVAPPTEPPGRSQPDETKTQFALRMDTPPVIDGNIDAAEWRQAGGSTGNWTVTIRPALDADGNPVLDDQGNPVNIIVGGAIGDAGTVPTSSADLSYTIQAGFDADNLYIAVRVKDDAISTDSAAEGSANGTTWMDDSVEVFIDGDNSNYPSRDTSGTNPSVVGSGGQFVITANNAYREAEAGNPGYGETAKWFAKTTVRSDGTGYDAEFRISLAAIGNPKPGELIGFSVGVNDDDTGGGAKRQVIWVGKPHTECTYGNLVLGQKSYTAPKASTAPTVDGVIHPEEYAGAQEITINGGFGTFYTGGMLDGLDRQDLSYRAWVVHDTDAVYVAVDVVDDKILTDSADPGSEDKTTWEDDSVEIFFDPTHAKNINRGPEKGTGQYVLTANGAWRDAEANNPTFGETEEWFAATKRTFKGYQVEFKVNKSVLQDPVDGKLMGFNIAVNDDDGKGRKAQLNWDGDPHHEFTYGELTLGGPVGGALRITKIDRSGNNLQLTFSSTAAAGSHTVQTRALVDSGPWTAVTGVTLGTGAGGALTATFPQPTAKTQFYRIVSQ